MQPVSHSCAVPPSCCPVVLPTRCLPHLSLPPPRQAPTPACGGAHLPFIQRRPSLPRDHLLLRSPGPHPLPCPGWLQLPAAAAEPAPEQLAASLLLLCAVLQDQDGNPVPSGTPGWGSSPFWLRLGCPWHPCCARWPLPDVCVQAAPFFRLSSWFGFGPP